MKTTRKAQNTSSAFELKCSNDLYTLFIDLVNILNQLSYSNNLLFVKYIS